MERVGRECNSVKTGSKENTGQYSDESKRTWLCMVIEDERHGRICWL